MNIDEMPAGRALDALVAERVMGWKTFAGEPGYGRPPGRITLVLTPIPPYSTDIAAAWQVVERITEPPRTLEEAERAANTRFGFWWDRANLWAYSAPEAAALICRAALKAVGGAS